jgi:4-diphosphocytidyl-2-C-methyl-D-erythritol kinase
MLTVSYAKINLFLEVLGRLPGNYHQVNTVLCSIDLFDEIKYALTKSGAPILWSSDAKLGGKENLIYRIANYLQDAYQVSESAEIYLEKNIPVAAGLGGGSSNAANAIEVLGRLWHLNLGEAVKEEVAARFGSDINFFLHGGTALGEHRGERITNMDDILIDNILLVNPGIAISAGTAYGALELPVPGEIKLFDPQNPIATMFNRLEAPVRRLYPEIDDLLLSMQEQGAQKSMLSGSGSTCFGIFDSAKDAARTAAFFAKKGYYTHITRTISRSEYQRCFLN